jgi:4-hydroxy-3-methylbut-2-enyl diphosphate reductase
MSDQNDVIVEQETVLTEPEAKKLQDAALDEMGGLKVYKHNDLVEGTIVQVTDDQLIVDIGTKTEGIIPREEIGLGGNPDMSEFAVGDPIKAVIIKEEDEEKPYYLSKRRADQLLVWDKVEDSMKEGTRIEAIGFRAVKGGLLVDIGTIAFLPQSLLDIRRIDDMESMVGQKFDVQVVEYDREAQPHPKIVVSRRSVLEEDLTRERDTLYDDLEAGKVYDGKVIKLTAYGGFIDVGGVQGLLHISEMSLGRIKHPSEVMKEGDTIKVKILKVDKKRKRISLGRRELLPNPWESINEKYKPGMVVQGTVVRTADFGAFIKLDDYFEGLAHISELVDNKISHAKEVFNPGDKVNVLVMNVDKRAKRIKLSVRRAAESQRRSEVDQFMKNQGELDNVFASRLREAMAESDFQIVKEPVAEAPIEAAPEIAAEIARPEETFEPAPENPIPEN